MTATPFEITKIEAISAAWALKNSATEAYCDERLTTAVTHYSLASRLFFAAGYPAKATVCAELSRAIGQEVLAIASGDDDAAQEASDEVSDLRQEL